MRLLVAYVADRPPVAHGNIRSSPLYHEEVTGEGRRDDHPGWKRPDGTKFWPAIKPLNAAPVPRSVPVRPQGSYAVIVRLLWDRWEELVPGTAIRWAEGRVLVTVKPPDAPSNVTELLCWLPVDDVYRTLPRRPRAGSPRA